MQRAGVRVVGAERRLAELERAGQHVARGGAVAGVEQGEAAQAAELDLEPVERVAGGQRAGELVGAIERVQRLAVIAEREQRLDAQAEHVRGVEARLALLGEEGGGGVGAERGGALAIAPLERGAGLAGEVEGAVPRVGAHVRARPSGRGARLAQDEALLRGWARCARP